MAEAKAQSMLVHCRTIMGRSIGGDVGVEQEFYVDHFSVTWTRRNGTAGSPKLLLITSQRVVFGDELRLRPIWETRIERIVRVEQKPGCAPPLRLAPRPLSHPRPEGDWTR
eukprot:7364460-Prymnesium_polylepis.1